MSSDYGWEKLHVAVHSLCGSGSQPERLVNAVTSSLIHITPENDIPKDIRQEFEEFMKEMTSVPAESDEGTIQATVNKMDEIALSNAVEKIISFYDSVCRQMDS
ncbi:MAG: hypothetical protein GXP23_07645 [Gammaproteobacteria bacterium]|nr:hypothetical protein [Gammaproteobacteria bacterium]